MYRTVRTHGAAWGLFALVLVTGCSASTVESLGAGNPVAHGERLASSIATDDAPPAQGRSGGVVTRTDAPVPARRAARALTAAMKRVPVGGTVVAPDGTSDGSGTLSRPLDLATALSGKAKLAGATVLLRGGTYRGAFTSEVEGTRDRPVTVRSFPGEWAVIDGGAGRAPALRVNGPDVVFRDLEVVHSRTGSDRRPQPASIPGAGFDVWAPNIQLINVVVHDNSTGIRLRWEAIDARVYGALVYNNGYLAAGRPIGDGIEIQNEQGWKSIEQTMIFNNFRYGIYGLGVVAYVAGISLSGNTIFGNGAPAGEETANVFLAAPTSYADRIRIAGSTFYHRGADGTNVDLGSRLTENGTLTLVGSDIVGGDELLSVRSWEAVGAVGNTLVRSRAASGQPIVELWTPDWSYPRDGFPDRYRWERNRYIDVAPGGKSFVVNESADDADGRGLTFAEWQERTTLDRTSTHARSVPREATVRVRPNTYEEGRATITVMNPDVAPTVEADIRASGLPRGMRFEVRDAENLDRVVGTGTYDRSPVRIQMRGGVVAQPVGPGEPVEHTPADFGAFVLIPLP